MNELLVILYTEQATHSFGTTADLNFLVDSHQHKVGSVTIQNKDHNADGKAEQVQVSLSFKNIDPTAIKSVVIIQSLAYAIAVSGLRLTFAGQGAGRV